MTSGGDPGNLSKLVHRWWGRWGSSLLVSPNSPCSGKLQLCTASWHLYRVLICHALWLVAHKHVNAYTRQMPSVQEFCNMKQLRFPLIWSSAWLLNLKLASSFWWVTSPWLELSYNLFLLQICSSLQSICCSLVKESSNACFCVWGKVEACLYDALLDSGHISHQTGKSFTVSSDLNFRALPCTLLLLLLNVYIALRAVHKIKLQDKITKYIIKTKTTR